MNRYIKLEDAISICREKQIIEGSAVTGIRYPRPDEIIYDLSNLSTIDIVHCKDCKWCLAESVCDKTGMVLFADEIENHFCGHGEGIEE